MHHPLWRPFTLVLFLLWLPASIQASQVQDTSRIDTILAQAWTMMYRTPDSALLLCQEALHLAEAKGLDSWAAKSENQIGVVYWVKSEHDTALVWLERAFDGYAALEDELGMGRVANNFGITYMAMDFYELAMHSFQDALPVMEQAGKPVHVATIYGNLGMVAHAIKDYEGAIDYFLQADEIIRTLPSAYDTSMIHNNIALCYRDAKEMEQALYHHKNAVSGYRTQDNYRGLVESLYNCGGCYALLDSFALADEIYQEALEVARSHDNPFLKGSVWLKIAELRVREEKPEAAISAADSSFAYLQASHGLKVRKAVFEVLAMAHAKIKSYELAYEYSQKINELEDSMLNAEMVRNINELTHKYESEIKDREIENLQQQKALSQWQKGGLAVIIVLVLIIFVVVFRRQRAIIRREKALQEKTREAAEAKAALGKSELKTAQLEKQRLEEEVRHKSKEISNLAMGIIRHHELLQNLDRGLQTIRKKANSEVKDEVQELAVMVVSQLGAEKERQDLQLYIEEAEQRFFQVLDSKYPQLTKRERRLCALIRMGYSSKEIAAIFNINPNSVDMGRYRLRKKLDPDMEITLNEFLDRLMLGE